MLPGVSTLFLILVLVLAVNAVNAVRPPATSLPALLRPPWLPSMLTSELVPVWALVLAVLTLLAWVLGVLDDPLGRVTLWLAVLTGLLYVILVLRAIRAKASMLAALDGHVEVSSWPLDPAMVLLPLPYRIPRDVVRVEDLEYAEGLELDLYRSSTPVAGPAPALLHIHGGSWSGGDRRQQGRPLIHEMASRGWVVASADYPLTPAATFPEPVEGLHLAVHWLRANAADLGIDPSRIYVTGESAGGHLAAMVALTDGHPDWSLRSEGDAPIAGAATMYGVYDLLDRNGLRDPWPLVANELIKADRTESPGSFMAGSPIDHVSSEAPAFLVVHGTHDSLVPIAESRAFVSALRAVSRNPCLFAAIPGASHSFDVVPSLRTQRVVTGVASFLDAHADVRGPADVEPA
jgi:acetyl esterase/lipase